MRSTHVLGTRYTFRKAAEVPTDAPVIFVANHQSMNDIPPLIWFFRKNHPKFVSKKELGKGIPSVSYNLRHSGAALIDRKDPKQALGEIAKLGRYIEAHNRSAVIFPEGTRSKTGHPRKFQPMGLKIMLKNAPSAIIVPISINNSWKLLQYGKFPYTAGIHFTIDVHAPIKNTGNVAAIIEEVEEIITAGITSFKR